MELKWIEAMPISETHWQKIHRVVNSTSTIHRELEEELILKVVVAKFISKIEIEFRNKLRIFFGRTLSFLDVLLPSYMLL